MDQINAESKTHQKEHSDRVPFGSMRLFNWCAMSPVVYSNRFAVPAKSHTEEDCGEPDWDQGHEVVEEILPIHDKA